jgi:hypothetical protein
MLPALSLARRFSTATLSPKDELRREFLALYRQAMSGRHPNARDASDARTTALKLLRDRPEDILYARGPNGEFAVRQRLITSLVAGKHTPPTSTLVQALPPSPLLAAKASPA